MHKITVNQPGSGGIAIAEAFVINRISPEVSFGHISDAEKREEEERFETALKRVADQIETLAVSNPLFRAHLDILQDAMLYNLVVSKINGENKNAGWSLKEAEEEICSLFSEIEDEYLRERSLDIKDVAGRIMDALQGVSHNPFADIGREVIVVADELFPSDTILMDYSLIRGWITRYGGSTSHVSIIARNKGIPSLAGVGEVTDLLPHGTLVILDPEKGEILIDPDEATVEIYRGKATAESREKARLHTMRNLEAITADGFPIDIWANASGVEEITFALENGARGIGLYRSEFLFMKSLDGFPGEETQFAEYRKAAELCGSLPLIVRTLDIGGDKNLPYYRMEPESNPFLGFRAIRISLSERENFKIQLRSLLRASAFGNLKIMFPMIISLEEWEAAEALVEECKEELRKDGLAFNDHTGIGIMIETPAAVMMAGELAARADFLSIGTNDLTQYTLAVDRLNLRVAHLYDPLHPAVIRSIRSVVEAATLHHTPVGICGELAGNREALKLLLGLGLSELSVSPALIPEIKSKVRETNLHEVRSMAEETTRLGRVTEIRSMWLPS